jgi:hypothetical protein
MDDTAAKAPVAHKDIAPSSENKERRSAAFAFRDNFSRGGIVPRHDIQIALAADFHGRMFRESVISLTQRTASAADFFNRLIVHSNLLCNFVDVSTDFINRR